HPLRARPRVGAGLAGAAAAKVDGFIDDGGAEEEGSLRRGVPVGKNEATIAKAHLVAEMRSADGGVDVIETRPSLLQDVPEQAAGPEAIGIVRLVFQRAPEGIPPPSIVI